MHYQNPVIRGFHPDPSICRVGKDYYLVTSSFEYFPALPIFHSTDLVNWEQVGNALTEDRQLDLSHSRESGGIWAPTIRYSDGMFYITVAMETSQVNQVNQFHNFIIHAKDIRGPWSDPVFVQAGGIDPSMLFENGKMYYCTNDSRGETRETVKAGVVDPMTGEILEPFRAVWHGEGGGWTEAPHLYHIGDWYYVFCAEGGTLFGHHEVCGRSRNIYGPYENCPHNPILTNRNDTKKRTSSTGHGDLVCDPDGNWWMVHLGRRPGITSDLTQLGRETFLTPVAWKDGWPVIADSRAHIEEDGPLTVQQRPWPARKDDFSDPAWPLWWQFDRNPDLSHFSRGNGRLTIRPFGHKPEEMRTEGLICTSQPDFDFRLETDLNFDPAREGEEAGVMAFLTHDFYAFFGLQRQDGKLRLFLERKMDDLDLFPLCEETDQTKVRLVMEGAKDFYRFGLQNADGSVQWKTQMSSRFLSDTVVGRCFTGTMVGLYAESREVPGTAAVFTNFILGHGADSPSA